METNFEGLSDNLPQKPLQEPAKDSYEVFEGCDIPSHKIYTVDQVKRETRPQIDLRQRQIADARFKIQFENPDKIKISDKKTLEVFDCRPENEKETPVFLLKGWGLTARSLRGVLQGLYVGGRRALAINNPNGIDSTEFEAPDEIKKVELEKVAALFAAMDAKKIEQTDIVAHSEGCLQAVYAAMLRPKKVRNLVLIDPAGMIGQDSRLALAIRTFKDDRAARKFANEGKYGNADLAKANMEYGAKGMTKVVKENFKEMMIDATGAITKSDIIESLKYLRAEGVKISIIHAVDDELFPMKMLLGNASKDMADGFYSIKGTHNQVGLYEGKNLDLVNGALDNLEALPPKKKF